MMHIKLLREVSVRKIILVLLMKVDIMTLKMPLLEKELLKNTITSAIVLVFLLSCTRGNEKHLVSGDVETQKIHIGKDTKVKLSSFVDRIEYQVLPNDLHVGFIDKMLYYKDLLIICDFDQLLSIHILNSDLDGVKASIKKYGEGPGEYITIIDVTVNTDLESIDILSFQKILRFDFEGNFVEEFKHPHAFTKFQHYKDKSYVAYIPSGLDESFYKDDEEGHILFEWDAEAQKISKILADPYIGRLPVISSSRNFTKLGNDWFFTANLADTIYEFDGRNNLKTKYFLDFDGKNLPNELIENTSEFIRKKLSSEEIFGKYLFQETNIMASDRKVLTSYRGTNKASGFIVYDKLSQGVVSGFLIENDIDMGLEPYFTPKLLKENVIYSVHEPEYFMNFYQQNQKKLKGVDNEFTRIVETLDLHSTGIITKYYLK